MQPDSAALLWDARRAAQLILDFEAGRTWEDYQANAMLRSAVERQFEIIGESFNRLSRADPLTATVVEDLPRIVSFRNVLCTATPRSTTSWSGRWPRPGSTR